VSGSCSREALALHVEGDLPPAAAGATARHLQGCEECQAFVAQLRATQALL
jgi:anti-sigma factor RsiW